MSRMFRLCTLLLAVIVPAAFGRFNSAIQRVITDPSGAVVPGATVRVINTETGVAREAGTSEEGLYRVLSKNWNTLKPLEMAVTAPHLIGLKRGWHSRSVSVRAHLDGWLDESTAATRNRVLA